VTNINALKYVVSCEVLDLEENSQNTCFGIFIKKTCEYVTMKEKNK
jgi:hypothetical protein